MTNREQLLQALHEGVVTVKFTKVNGDVREMRCTLREDILPARQADNAAQARRENPDVQSVWDVEKAAWRSFRWENVIND